MSKDKLYELLDRNPTVCQPILAAANSAVAQSLKAFRNGPKYSDLTGNVFMVAFNSALQHSLHGPYPIKPLEDAPYTHPVFHSYPVRVSKTAPMQILAMATLYSADAYFTRAYLLKPGDRLKIIEGHPLPSEVTSDPDPSTVEAQVDYNSLVSKQEKYNGTTHHVWEYFPLFDPFGGKTLAQYMAVNSIVDMGLFGPSIVIPTAGSDEVLRLVYTNLPAENLATPFQDAGLLVTRLTPHGHDNVCWIHNKLRMN